MPLLRHINPSGLANNFLLMASMAFGGSEWSSLAWFERNCSNTASYHAFALMWGSVLSHQPELSKVVIQKICTLCEEKGFMGITVSYWLRQVSIWRAVKHWCLVSSQSINNKLLVDVHTFGLGFVLDFMDKKLQMRVQASHCTDHHCMTRRVRASQPGSQQESPFPFRQAGWDSAYLWDKWLRSGKKLYLPSQISHTQGNSS